MKRRHFVLAVILLFLTKDYVLADRQLTKEEILTVFKTLTKQSRDTWISAGTIEAKHLEYKAQSGYATDSNVIVKYDGEKFYWEINITSHTKLTEALGDYEKLDLKGCTRRVFIWDSDKYTRYFRPINHAVVTENPSDVPVVVNGPLTAGIVPWGYGIYTFEELSIGDSSAIEVDVDGHKQLHLTIFKEVDELILEMFFILDPAKNYAVLSYSLDDGCTSSIKKTYNGYKIVSGNWIPTTIIIEQYDEKKQSAELLSYDHWNLTSINTTLPTPDSFSIEYENGTLESYKSSITDKTLSYHHSSEIDIDSLLIDRLLIIEAQHNHIQNCAIIAIKYVAKQLGKNLTDQVFAPLLEGTKKETSLYELQQFISSLGLSCLAVKTDIQTLKGLRDYQVILHLPATNHYVVLEHIDDDYAWIIDLSSDKFYYRTKLDDFGRDWSEGVAILISDNQIYPKQTFTELSDDQLHEIIGGDGTTKYSCTKVIQNEGFALCHEPIAMLCGGCYYEFYKVRACEENENGGDCTGTSVLAYEYTYCINHPQWPGACTITGVWYPRYMRGCE